MPLPTNHWPERQQFLASKQNWIKLWWKVTLLKALEVQEVPHNQPIFVPKCWICHWTVGYWTNYIGCVLGHSYNILKNFRYSYILVSYVYVWACHKIHHTLKMGKQAWYIGRQKDYYIYVDICILYARVM